MNIEPGVRLGPYEILGAIGAGGVLGAMSGSALAGPNARSPPGQGELPLFLAAAPTQEEAQGKKFIIEEVLITNVTVHAAMVPVGGSRSTPRLVWLFWKPVSP